MAIACVYCGGSHDRPAEVKECWSRSHSGQPVLPEKPVSTAPVAAASTPVRVGRGPSELGRNCIVGGGQAAPGEWSGCDRVVIDDAAIASPATAFETLRTAAHGRQGLVIELATDFDTPPASTASEEPFLLGARFSFLAEELFHFVWSNSVDARTETRFAPIDRAVQLGASVSDGAGDIVGRDGNPAWIDAGPVRFTAPIDGVSVVHNVSLEHGSAEPFGTNECGADLAPDQLAAVTHEGSVARIIAPAGSGKTRVLTERARHLVNNWKLPGSAVTLVAFNKRAQIEMAERARDVAGLEIRTLNAISLAIINGDRPFGGQRRRWRTIDEVSVRGIVNKLVTVPKRRNTDPLAPWIDALSLVRLGLVEPRLVEAKYGGDVDGLADVWARYRDALDREGSVDFDDQIYRAIEVLLTDPAARASAQLASRVLLVDEFQDLTPAHLLLVRLLAGPGGAVFGVGDDDQTIYGYNGADPASLIEFAKIFPGAGDHPLEVNYRCGQEIVDAVDKLLRHNRRRVPKEIRAAAGAESTLTRESSEDPVAASVDAVGATIESGAATSEIAVLTRVNATIAPIQVALTEAGVPISGGVGTNFADRTSVRAVLGWLRLAQARSLSADDIREALRRPSRSLHPRITDWVCEQRDTAALRRLADRLNNDRDADKVHGFAEDIDRLAGRFKRGATTAELISEVIDGIGLASAVNTLDNSRRGMNKAAQGDDLLAMAQLGRLHSDVASFERWLVSNLAVKRSDSGVTLTTIHRVKGLEWPHVVVHLADKDQFPHRLSDDIEEERRLFHVAVTRASRTATVVSGSRPSVFVDQLFTEPPDKLPEPEPEPRLVSKSPGKAVDHPLLDRTSVMAVVGLELTDQGTNWEIIEIEPAAAVATNGKMKRRFGIGSKVETAGRQRGNLTGRHPDVSERSAVIFDKLREFRNDVRNGKPAYTVFADKALANIATAAPTSLEELSRVSGVGPAKLEQYGDAVVLICTED